MFFSMHQVSVRKGSVNEGTKIRVGTLVSILTTASIFTLITLVLVSFYKFTVNLEFVELMVVAGILHFFLARTLFYMCIDRLGANVAATLATTRIAFAALFGLIFLNEFPKVKTLLMAVFVFTGVAILTFKVVDDFVGILLGISTGAISALSSVFVKEGMFFSNLPFAIYGTAIGYTSALLVFVVVEVILTYITKSNRNFYSVSNFSPYTPFIIGGIFVGIGHCLRYFALSKYSVCTVETFVSVYPIFTYALSGLFLRKFEVFNKKFLISLLLVFTGVELYLLAK